MKRKTFLCWMNAEDQPSSVISAKLGNAEKPFFVRLTGGCGFMSRSDGEESIKVLLDTLTGFNGVLLYGGTRVYEPSSSSLSEFSVFPTILEVPPMLRKINRGMMSFGIIPRLTNVEFDADLGLIISKNDENGFLTVIHPNQDICLVLQRDVDRGFPGDKYWDIEWRFCLEVVKSFLENRNNSGTVLISYNGGVSTGKEIEAWANNNWPVILFENSGRVTTEFCRNTEWLAAHPSVFVAKSSEDAREQLTLLGGLS